MISTKDIVVWDFCEKTFKLNPDAFVTAGAIKTAIRQWQIKTRDYSFGYPSVIRWLAERGCRPAMKTIRLGGAPAPRRDHRASWVGIELRSGPEVWDR